MLVRIDRQPAFVLHRRAYRETSLLLDMLTRDHGRLSVVARGARRGARGAAGSCQPFQSLLLSCAGRSELKSLSGIERVGRAARIDGASLYAALYVNEILVRTLAPSDPHPRLFEAYSALLSSLAGAVDVEPRLRAFELLLLEELGYGIELDREAGSGELMEAQADYLFTPGDGFSRAREDVDAGVYPGWTLRAMAVGDYTDALTRRLAKRLMRSALAPVLGDRPLLSREFFRARRTGSSADI